ncbi:hypothetical protein HZ994_18650 [Akkermansiaceae bacterium]|nr:hypothetical protein HZ994_18650 [Akkermansiaceae bacterium]
MKLTATLAAFLLAACSAPTEPLVVKQFTLRDQDTLKENDPMVRNEKLRRLYGAVSLEERKGRLGQYYTVIWSDTPTGTTRKTGREIRFQYQQGGSKVKTMTRSLEPGASSGKEEFAIIGDDYFQNGRVLTWKIDLLHGGAPIASKQSYLWE